MPVLMFALAIIAFLLACGAIKLLIGGLFGLARVFWALIPFLVLGYVLYVVYCKLVGKPIAYKFVKEEKK